MKKGLLLLPLCICSACEKPIPPKPETKIVYITQPTPIPTPKPEPIKPNYNLSVLKSDDLMTVEEVRLLLGSGYSIPEVQKEVQRRGYYGRISNVDEATLRSYGANNDFFTFLDQMSKRVTPTQLAEFQFRENARRRTRNKRQDLINSSNNDQQALQALRKRRDQIGLLIAQSQGAVQQAYITQLQDVEKQLEIEERKFRLKRAVK